MAENPRLELVFRDGCPDCGEREVNLPAALPSVGDDFDWLVRDYEGFRRAMLEELVARYPERRRWTAADVEMALVEALAAMLDQLSDMLDRVASEAFLETARRPESVRNLLSMIGYDALGLSKRVAAPPFGEEPHPDDTRSDTERFDQYWLDNPHQMDAARVAGPRAIDTQRRMVTLEDHATRLEEHPLVERAHARVRWSGSWRRIEIAALPWQRTDLDAADVTLPDDLWQTVETFHAERGIFLFDREAAPTIRSILRSYIEAYRMAGQEVTLQRAQEVGILISLSIEVDPNYFQSEVRRAVRAALGTGPDGFFEHGRLRFGEDLHAGDLFATLMSLDGVENVCLNRFKRLGTRFPDQSESGRIELEGLEIAVCDNDAQDPARGYYHLTLGGGRRG